MEGSAVKNKTLSILFGMLILTSNGFAQSKWNAEINGGWNFVLSSGIFSNWGSGWNAGVGASCQVNSNLQLAATAAYHYFPYQGGNVQVCFPMVLGLNTEIEGDDSYSIESSVSARFNGLASFLGPYVALRVGLQYIKIGRISIVSQYDSDPDSYSNVAYKGTDIQKIQPFGFIGGGFTVPVSSDWRIKLESGFAGTLDGEQIFIPILSTIQFNL